MTHSLRKSANLAASIHIFVLLFVTALLFIPCKTVYAWDLELLEAIDAVAAGNATDWQLMVAFTRNREINEMALDGVIPNATYQRSQSRFFDLNQEFTMDAAEQAGLRVKALKKPDRFKPGTDTDAPLTTRGDGSNLSLRKLEQVEQNYQNRIRKYFADKGVRTPPGNVNTDTDFLPDPDVTPDEEFEECVKHIKANGGTAYSTKDAARAQIKLDRGSPLGADEINAYNREMRLLASEKLEKASKLRARARSSIKYDKAEAARLEAKAHLNDAQASKYVKRINKATNQLRKQNGLEPLKRNITGLDQTDDIIDAARGAGTKLDAIAVHNLQKQAMEKASHELIESAADIIRANGAREASLRKIIATEMNTLSPAARGRALQSLESRLSTDVVKRVVKDVRAMEKATVAAGTKAETLMGNKLSFDDIPKLKVVMISGTAILMAKAGYDYTIENVKPDDTVLDWIYNMTKNSLWYGSGIGGAFEESQQLQMEQYKREYEAGMHPEWNKHASLAVLGTIMYMGRDAIVCLLTLPGSLILGWDELTGAAERERREEISKEFYAALHKMVLQKKEFEKAYSLAKKMDLKTEKDIKPFLDCMCDKGCTMTFGAIFNPDFNGPGIGPCQCSGPLTIIKSPISHVKDDAYYCFNKVAKIRYNEDMAWFDKWHRQAMLENEKSVAGEMKKVKNLIRTQRQTWKEDTVEAANIFNNIKDLANEDDKHYVRSVATPRLINAAEDDMLNGELQSAVKMLELAKTVGGKESSIDQLLPQYQGWLKTWGKATAETIPDIRRDIQEGDIGSAKNKLNQLRYQMTTQGGRILPPLNDHPILVSLDKELLDRTNLKTGAQEKASKKVACDQRMSQIAVGLKHYEKQRWTECKSILEKALQGSESECIGDKEVRTLDLARRILARAEQKISLEQKIESKSSGKEQSATSTTADEAGKAAPGTAVITPNCTNRLKAALNNVPDDPQAYERVRNDLLNILRDCPDNCYVLYNIGWTYRRQGQHRNALEWFRKASQCDPSHESMREAVTTTEKVLSSAGQSGFSQKNAVSATSVGQVPGSDKASSAAVNLAPDKPASQSNVKQEKEVEKRPPHEPDRTHPRQAVAAWVLKKTEPFEKPDRNQGGGMNKVTATPDGCKMTKTTIHHQTRKQGVYESIFTWNQPPPTLIPGQKLAYNFTIKAITHQDGGYPSTADAYMYLALQKWTADGKYLSGGNLPETKCAVGSGGKPSASNSGSGQWEVPSGSKGTLLVVFPNGAGAGGSGGYKFIYDYMPDYKGEISSTPDTVGPSVQRPKTGGPGTQSTGAEGQPPAIGKSAWNITRKEPGQAFVPESGMVYGFAGQYSVSAVAPGGNIMAPHPTPWEFHSDGTLEARGFWTGRWDSAMDGSLNVTINYQGQTDSFTVKFYNNYKEFKAYKNNILYRYGKRIGGAPAISALSKPATSPSEHPNASGPVNVALNKNALQSSTGYGGNAVRAVDGNNNGSYVSNSITHTNSEAGAWWQVDLERAYPIQSIRIWNRTDCCSDRLSNFYVLVSNSPFPSRPLNLPPGGTGTWYYYHRGTAAVQTNIPVSASGRYVRIQLAGTNYLSLAEVEVFTGTR